MSICKIFYINKIAIFSVPGYGYWFTVKSFLKKNGYPRIVKPVLIKEGAVINPGSIITAGVTIGKNSMVGVGSVVSKDIPDYSVVVGNPARVVKKIEH